MVAVECRARSHSTGIVGDDSSYGRHGTARRIGTENPLVRCKRMVHGVHNRPGLDPNSLTVFKNLDPCPIPTHIDQNIVALLLSVQTGPRSPESDGAMVLGYICEDFRNIFRGMR